MTRVLIGTAVFAGGVVASGALSAAVPADACTTVPIVGCPTTVLPSLPLPTLPTTTATSTSTTPVTTPAATTSSTTSAETTTAASESALRVQSWVRVRGRGARRVVELRIDVTKDVRVNALLRRGTQGLAQRQLHAPGGKSLVILRVARATRAGLATLIVVFRTETGETARTTHRVRLPR